MRSPVGCATVESVSALNGLTIRSVEDRDWPAITTLAAAGFGGFRPQETTAMWRTMVPEGGAVVACDGPDIVGMALFLDLRLTVPGGAVLPMAGVSWVVVAPTHRRRGVLTAMFVELHRRMGEASYPIAGLEASEDGIYARFGYGPATIQQSLSVDRRAAKFHADAPDPGGVRLVRPQDHRREFEDVYERWRLRTPGGLHTPSELWDEVMADRAESRGGGTAFLALLHADGFAMYRVHGGERKSVQITKVAAVTSDAHAALWRVLLGMDLMSTVDVATHHAEPLPYLLTNPRVVRQTGSEDGLWLRIRDIAAVLEARTYEADLSAVLDVSDGVLGGGGRFSLEISDGRARCTPTDAEPDVELSLSVLGSLYLGVHRASSFATAHRLRCNDSGLLRRLDAAFISTVPAELGYGF